MKKLFPLLLILILVLGCVQPISPQEEEPIQLQQPEKPKVQRCEDKTPYDFCSINKPFFCEEGELIEKCSQCGCPENLDCINEKCTTCEPTCTTTCGGEPNGCGGNCAHMDSRREPDQSEKYKEKSFTARGRACEDHTNGEHRE